MSVKIVSHINGDSDLIEAWLKYYLRLGVDEFRLVVHGPPEENETLWSLKSQYPIVIKSSYEGPFHIDEKKRRLNAILEECRDEWILLADSDEFVEFPYRSLDETVGKLQELGANLMAAPMLQRLTSDGSLETPAVIEDPFQMFPRCSVDLYRQMGAKGDIFKFPLFYCVPGTELAEGGNHHPPRGAFAPRGTNARGVTHHFKFRRTVSRRLEKRINSEHPWRHESVQFRQYLESHSNRLPLEGSFVYQRDGLFQRGFLKQVSAPLPSGPECIKRASTTTPPISADAEHEKGSAGAEPGGGNRGDKIVVVLPKTGEFGGLEKHLIDLLTRLRQTESRVVILSFGEDRLSEHLPEQLKEMVEVRCLAEPQSFWQWTRMFLHLRADVVLFCYSWLLAFSWHGPLAAWCSGVRRRFAIQHLIPPPPPPAFEGTSLLERLRARLGRRARYIRKVSLVGHTSDRTICVSNAVRDALIRDYRFPSQKTITIHNGVATSVFTPVRSPEPGIRRCFDIREDDFLIVCCARLSEAKGVDILIHAVSRVLRQGVPVKCIILGDGPLKDSLVNQANSLGLTGYLHFAGFHKDVRPFLQAASAFALTSHLEGLPLSVLEAMACGLPCVVTNVGGNAEAVRDRVTGLVIRDGSLEDAEDAILNLATHPDDLEAMARRGREVVCAEFDLETQMDQLRTVILGQA